MISFLLATGLTVTAPVYPAPGQQGHLVTTQAEDSFKIGKFLENNWVVLLGGVIFLIRLQNSVEDIKKDNQNKNELLSKDFELIKFSLDELREQIDKTAGTAKEDVKRVSLRLVKHQQKLDKFIDLVNHDRIGSGKSPFVIDHSGEDDF